jgi:dolichol-phosphate mannosyltransferase
MPDSRFQIILPTFNENENISELLPKLIKTFGSRVHILVIDDNSPDGTAITVNKLVSNHPNIHLLTRPNRLGVASAFIEGLQNTMRQNFEYAICMDSDFSHQVEDLVRLIEFALSEHKYKLIIGSRYIHGGSINGVPLYRIFLSRLGNKFARFCIGTQLKDVTGGFRIYRTASLQKLEMNNLSKKGYGFQLEILNFFYKNKFETQEIAIQFLPRKYGKSKLTFGIVLEVIRTCFKILYDRIK